MTIIAGNPSGVERLLTGEEMATLFVVDEQTIRRWARAGLLKSVVTPGGRLRRYNPADYRELVGTAGSVGV